MSLRKCDISLVHFLPINIRELIGNSFFRAIGISEKYRQFPFTTRRNAITDEYEVSKESLGVGISGKVLTCTNRETKRKCALKVNLYHRISHQSSFIRFIQIIKDSDKARREVILHKRACEGCSYIVQVLDIYVWQCFQQTIIPKI